MGKGNNTQKGSGGWVKKNIRYREWKGDGEGMSFFDFVMHVLFQLKVEEKREYSII